MTKPEINREMTSSVPAGVQPCYDYLDFPTPDTPFGPLPYLDAVEVWRCPVCWNSYLTKSRKCLDSHLGTAHARIGKKGLLGNRVLAQRWFSNPRRTTWFPVAEKAGMAETTDTSSSLPKSSTIANGGALTSETSVFMASDPAGCEITIDLTDENEKTTKPPALDLALVDPVLHIDRRESPARVPSDVEVISISSSADDDASVAGHCQHSESRRLYE